MRKHTILFLAANPSGTDRLALDQEARAIQMELERSGYRDCFELETRWAAEPLDLLRELRKLKPIVVHFSGHGVPATEREHPSGEIPHQDVVFGKPDLQSTESQQGLLFHGVDGRAQVVSTAALERTIDAAGTSVKLVVLSVCYSDAHADALLAHVDCVVGMRGSVHDDAARSFAIGFYGGLGERESVAAAYKQGCAAISLEGLRDADRPQLKVRDGVDPSQLILVSAPDHEGTAEISRTKPGPSWRRRLCLATAAMSLVLATSLVLSAEARRTACGAPGLRSLCVAVGIGDVPTPAEQALWDDALNQDSEDGLQAYLQQYPTGAYAEEAHSRLAGCRTKETLGAEKDVPLPLTIRSGSVLSTEDEARRDALARGNREASTMCRPFAETDLIVSAWAEPGEWKCHAGEGGFACGFDGEIVCRVRNRIKAKYCRQP